MARTLQELLAVLDLERLEVDLFRGRSPDTQRQRVFGGLVAGQALVAAGRTVPAERRVHSLHAYFLRPGDATTPIVYAVERMRDGRSFTTRRAVATQHGRPIFVLSASFQVDEGGFEHQAPMPAAPDPATLPAPEDDRWGAFALRYASGWGTAAAQPYPEAHGQIWFRTQGPMPDDALLHHGALVYISDLSLLPATLLPHGLAYDDAGVQMASIDHAMWFHGPVRVDDWLLYDQHSPRASGARGFARGQVFTRDGTLVASVAQEGLIRPVRDPAPGTGAGPEA
jgi:acyl-CoA thioesterase II